MVVRARHRHEGPLCGTLGPRATGSRQNRGSNEAHCTTTRTKEEMWS